MSEYFFKYMKYMYSLPLVDYWLSTRY